MYFSLFVCFLYQLGKCQLLLMKQAGDFNLCLGFKYHRRRRDISRYIKPQPEHKFGFIRPFAAICLHSSSLLKLQFHSLKRTYTIFFTYSSLAQHFVFLKSTPFLPHSVSCLTVFELRLTDVVDVG